MALSIPAPSYHNWVCARKTICRAQLWSLVPLPTDWTTHWFTNRPTPYWRWCKGPPLKGDFVNNTSWVSRSPLSLHRSHTPKYHPVPSFSQERSVVDSPSLGSFRLHIWFSQFTEPGFDLVCAPLVAQLDLHTPITQRLMSYYRSSGATQPIFRPHFNLYHSKLCSIYYWTHFNENCLNCMCWSIKSCWW